MSNNKQQNYVKLPPISSIDLVNHTSWMPSKSPESVTSSSILTTQQEQQWKSPPYHYSAELKRDISFRDNTLPIMQQQVPDQHHQKVESDINTVIQECHTLSDTIISNKNEILNSKLNNLDDMIHSANEVLNALLRLRKHQLSQSEHYKNNFHDTSHTNHVGKQRRREVITAY